MKDKLKTLKDLKGKITCSNATGRLSKEYMCETYEKELKAEAVKWVKELKEDREPLNAIGFIKEFFNLTSEDFR